MALVSLAWYSSDCLVCRDTEQAPVVICVDPAFVLPPNCPETDIPNTAEYGFIEATISEYVKIKDSCNSSVCVLKYVLTYEDEQLVPDVELTAEDIIQVLCKDCLTSYIEQKIGDEVHLRANEDGSLTLVSQHGCEYTFWPGEPQGSGSE